MLRCARAPSAVKEKTERATLKVQVNKVIKPVQHLSRRNNFKIFSYKLFDKVYTLRCEL